MAATLTKDKIAKQQKPRSRALLKSILKTALRKKFPEDTIDISDGFEGNLHILVVSRIFDNMGERTRQAFLWRIVERTELTEAEKELITVLLAVSPRELK